MCPHIGKLGLERKLGLDARVENSDGILGIVKASGRFYLKKGIKEKRHYVKSGKIISIRDRFEERWTSYSVVLNNKNLY